MGHHATKGATATLGFMVQQRVGLSCEVENAVKEVLTVMITMKFDRGPSTFGFDHDFLHPL